MPPVHPQEGRGGKQAGAGRITGMVGEPQPTAAAAPSIPSNSAYEVPLQAASLRNCSASKPHIKQLLPNCSNSKNESCPAWES